MALSAASLVLLWLLRPVLTAVYGDLGDIASIDARWVLAIIGCEATSFTASWELNRLALRTDGWFDVAVAQLSGNAASNVVPAGGPVGAAVQLRVLSEAGFDLTRAATALGALSILGFAGLLALPAIALPLALVAGTSDPRLESVLWIGVGLLAVVLLAGATVLRRDAPLERVAVGVQWVRNRVHPGAPRSDLPVLVLAERDSISTALGARPALVVCTTVGRTAADFAALYLSLLAVGAHPAPIVVLVAFSAAAVAGMIPFTPGGLGFVEAGITATLVAAGIDPAHAALAAALYRLASTWLPVALGLLGYMAFRYRHHTVTVASTVCGGVEGRCGAVLARTCSAAGAAVGDQPRGRCARGRDRQHRRPRADLLRQRVRRAEATEVHDRQHDGGRRSGGAPPLTAGDDACGGEHGAAERADLRLASDDVAADEADRDHGRGGDRHSGDPRSGAIVLPMGQGRRSDSSGQPPYGTVRISRKCPLGSHQ